MIEWAQTNKIDPYAPKEVLSPAQMEKRAGKGLKKEIAQFTESKYSGTVLFMAAYDRPPVKRITADDFAVFETPAAKKEVVPVSLF